jgi:hypothetical protein
VKQGRWTAEIDGRHLARDLPRAPGEYEAIDGTMAPRGLGEAGRLVPLAEPGTARLRVKKAAPT